MNFIPKATTAVANYCHFKKIEKVKQKVFKKNIYPRSIDGGPCVQSGRCALEELLPSLYSAAERFSSEAPVWSERERRDDVT